MTYYSRVYRQRNAHTHDESVKEPFFTKTKKTDNPSGKLGGAFQAKLTVNEPGDQYEQEADNVAHAVVNKPSRAPVVQQKKISAIQRLSTPVEDEKLGTNDARMEKDKEIQEKPIQQMSADHEKDKLKGVQKMDDPKKEKEKPIQKKDTAAPPVAPAHVSSRIERSAGKGNTMSAKTMKEMNSSFGVYFGSVRIHKDGEAVNMNKELQAQAFTHGSDIYFNEGKYDPETAAGKFLLAHELTHVVQQKEGIAKMDIQKDDDPARRDPLATQPGGPLETDDQLFTVKVNEAGKFEGCGPVPGTSKGGDNACISADSIDQIRNYFKRGQKPPGVKQDPPANCPANRWNALMNFCCAPGKIVDSVNPTKCIDEQQVPISQVPKPIPVNESIPIPEPVPKEKGDYELPDPATQMV